jgi:hypothetical protein
MFISYQDVKVSANSLARLKRAMDESEKEKKYSRYRAWAHYANLDRWQRQGHHFFYASGAEGSYCTCGLVAGKKANKGAVRAQVVDRSVAKSLAHLKLEPIHLVTGHVNLPSLRGKTVALIVNFKWEEDLGDYLWDIICQKCAGFELQISQADAQAFVKSHNARCKSRGA